MNICVYILLCGIDMAVLAGSIAALVTLIIHEAYEHDNKTKSPPKRKL